MKQLLVLSGKGGTGKTTIVASFIELAKSKAYADCDVDAPNLHLVTEELGNPQIESYYGMNKAQIDSDLCINCGQCETYCRFGAIESLVDNTQERKSEQSANNASFTKNTKTIYQVNPYACEGCSVCEMVCPVGAVSMEKAKDGETYVYNKTHVFSTAKLKMGSGTSGKLVTTVKKNLKDHTDKIGLNTDDLVILDGSPGIGCPVISSVSGVDMMLIVAEPSLSGISDMERVAEVGKHFSIPMAICVNKYNVNEEMSNRIKDYANHQHIDFVGVIPYDKKLVEITNKGLTPIRQKTKATEPIIQVFSNTIKSLTKETV